MSAGIKSKALAMILCWVAPLAFAGRWHDDFNSSGLVNWEIFNLDRRVEGWEQGDGVMTGQIFEQNFLSLLLLTPRGEVPDEWENYEVRVRARLISNPGANDEARFGVSLYDQGFDENRYVCLLSFATGEMQLIRATAGVWQAIPVPFPVEADLWYDLYARVETTGNIDSLTFQVDDNPPVTIVATTPLQSGGVGLVVQDSEVEFDDFEVIGANIPEGGRGIPRAVSPIGQAVTSWALMKTRSLGD